MGNDYNNEEIISDNNNLKNRVKFFTHKDKPILFVDFSNLRGEEIVEVLKEAKNFVDLNKLKDYNVLVDAHNAVFNENTQKYSSEISQTDNAALARKQAIVGIKGIQNILIKAINVIARKPIKIFDDMEEAKEWLANDEE